MNEELAKKLGQMIQCETINDGNMAKFEKFQKLLKKLFPYVFKTCKVENFKGSLLIRWKGKDSKLEPIMFMNHQDVVPATGKWKYDPFKAEIHKGKMYGRGTLDTKGGLFAMLEAANQLIQEKYVPNRDIYFEMACNEETTGEGADTISKTLQKRGIHFYFVSDEGGMIVYEPISGVKANWAMVGVGEKGSADLKFIAHSNGGHASAPIPDTPLVRLGKFMAEVDKGNIFEVKINDVVKEMFKRLSKDMDGSLKEILSRPTLFEPILKKVMPKTGATANALLQTTIAFTMAEGSAASNVIPETASVIANMRFSHHEGNKASFKKIADIASKYDIETVILNPGFESNISDFKSEPFKLLEASVSKNFPGVKTTPYIQTSASDSRYMSRVSDCCLRFTPFMITNDQVASIHGLNENVNISDLDKAVNFYKDMMHA